ncbi:MAG TPA: peptidoglycan-associated lipoprotein Pal [Syntrophorhabdaceae bacterium]|nr:peptidoglycan-associated lipoprotein Pal [Syntrophorhabdaceae bacterium]
MKFKLHLSLILVLLVLLVGLVLGGCGCFQQQMRGEKSPPTGPRATVTSPEAKAQMPVTAGSQPGAQGMAPASVVMLKDINFDFDKSNIREKDALILKDDTGWFKNNAGKKVRIEGNCDERGTVEYNLALGQRRADATKNFLMNLGINSRLLETVSYGKEKPICQEHDEACWARNRRAHFTPLQ